MSSGLFGSVRTKTAGIEKVNELFARQLGRAEGEGASPNEAIHGDSDAKRAFWVLLDMQSQRLVFIQQCRSTAFWPRIRSLIGSPPFSFLLPRDDSILNPGGICLNRAHTAPKEQAAILSSNEIGRGHFEDKYKRIFIAIASDAAQDNALPFRSTVVDSRIVLDMKIPPKPNTLRSDIRKRGSSSAKKTISFPTPNEVLELELQPDLRGESFAPVSVRVLRCQQRSAASPVVRVFGVVCQGIE
jgi:hypothetical protein